MTGCRIEQLLLVRRNDVDLKTVTALLSRHTSRKGKRDTSCNDKARRQKDAVANVFVPGEERNGQCLNG